MLARGRRVGAAVSGGADSVFLLHALRESGLAAAVLHVNHKLRGAESDADEAFVGELAQSFGLPFYVAVCPVGAGNLEQEARRARYAFFREAIAAGRCDSVATGHTLDDQAETVLSRFLRGAGTAGLSGIRPATRDGIVRPLLGARRDDIREWLRERNIAWREDRSNSDTEFLRNRLRHEVMPRLTEVNPSLAEVLGSTAEWALAEEEWWAAEIDRLEPEIFQTGLETVLFRTGGLLALPAAVQRRALRRAVERVRGSLRSIDFRHIEAIRRLAQSREGSGRIQLPDLDVYRSFDWLRLAPPGYDSRQERDYEAGLTVPGATTVPGRGVTMLTELVAPSPVYNSQMDVLDWGRCEGLLTVRNWRPGDRYTPAGRAGAGESAGPPNAPEKIKTLFQEHRIPLWERRHWPVIAKGDSILWARRFGVAREYAVGPETSRVLAIREAGPGLRDQDDPHSGESNRTLAASIESGGAFRRADSPERAPWPGEPGAEVL